MKRLYTYITILTVGLVTFCSCAEEELICSFVESGNDVTLKLSVQTQANKNIALSRATAEENKLYDLHFYVFNAQGKLTGYEKFVSGTGEIASPGLPDPIPVTIRTKTGSSYIYALANINRGSIYKLSGVDRELLNVTSYATNNKTTEQDEIVLRDSVELAGSNGLDIDFFRQITFNRTLPDGNEVISPSPSDNIFMMSGYLNDGAAVTIQRSDDGGIIQEGVDVIKLYRILAKNKFTINSPIDNATQRPRFTLKSYRLCNVPVGGQLVPKAQISSANTADAYYTTDNTTTAGVESHYEGFTNESSFTFYYPENLQKTESVIETWEQRETNSYATGSKVFTNAPAKAAYIEIQGDYVDNTGKLSANVAYTIHLGNFGETAKGGSKSNFNVIRNNNYIYTVTINGVNDIIAEAQIDSTYHNDNPYAEGFVVHVGDGQHYDVDAHYEARVLKFTKSSIQKLKNAHSTSPGYILNVSTPFGSTIQTVNVKDNGVYTMANVPICTIAQATDIDNPNNSNIKAQIFGDSEADFRWIRFVRNTDANVTKEDNDISLYTCKFPGVENRYSSTNTGGWMNVFELLAQLYNEDTYTDNNYTEAYYTCFIDENYYDDKQWSEYVNQEPRTMQIANQLEISEDNKSVYAEVAYSISQQSIATFYKNNTLVAFGTEIIDEEDKYSKAPYNYQNIRMGEPGSTVKYEIFPPSTDNDDNWNGYDNAVTTNWSDNIDKGWYSHSETKRVATSLNNRGQKNYQNITLDLVNIYPDIQPLYGAVGKACMSRNRDNDGDGKIDADEVRWYLASAQQYHALYIAKKSLPAEAALISEDELATLSAVDYKPNWAQSGHDIRGKYHYYTSSPMGGAGTYWPEEGMTNNGVDLSNSFMQRAELVRCVRTLQNNNEGLLAPQKYYTYDVIADNTFDLSGIETRRAEMPVLGNHHELQDMNELNKKFEVATKSLYGNESYSLLNLTSQEKDPCKDEYSQKADKSDLGTWRTPNQKEVALMLAEIPAMKDRRHGTRTRFSATIADDNPVTDINPNGVSWHGPYRWHQRYGFSVEGSNGKFNVTGNDYIDNNTTTRVDIRCVRDIP